MTHGEIHGEFAARRLTPEEAAERIMALRPQPSRVTRALAYLLPYALVIGLLALMGWKCK